ncbi:hypothetical protein KAW11_04200 [Candidatus Bathyarchaeota archaeon]|nr:hypothetical protein [Candidatus Bathyarchaeota archaeon]
MAIEKCSNCGEKLLSTYMRNGLSILICPHVKMSATKSLAGIPIHTEIACSLNVSGLRHSFETLKNGVDLTLEDLQEATQHTVSNATLLEQANLALMLNLPSDDLANLFECAFQLGLAVGITPQRAIEALCRGVGRRSRLILDNIGITFKPNDAYTWYKTTKKLATLTNPQKTEAWQKYAIHLIKKKAERLRK